MSQKKIARHTSNAQTTDGNTVVTSSVPSKKTKKDQAKQTLYINRI
jgi:hypothetical protein